MIGRVRGRTRLTRQYRPYYERPWDVKHPHSASTKDGEPVPAPSCMCIYKMPAAPSRRPCRQIFKTSRLLLTPLLLDSGARNRLAFRPISTANLPFLKPPDRHPPAALSTSDFEAIVAKAPLSYNPCLNPRQTTQDTPAQTYRPASPSGLKPIAWSHLVSNSSHYRSQPPFLRLSASVDRPTGSSRLGQAPTADDGPSPYSLLILGHRPPSHRLPVPIEDLFKGREYLGIFDKGSAGRSYPHSFTSSSSRLSLSTFFSCP
jgi:hypothetical protein